MSYSIENFLNGKFIRRLYHDRRGHYIKLKERDPGAKLRTVIIKGLNRDSCLIKLDEIKIPSTIFKNDRSCGKLCDYVLITKQDNENVLIFLELKSSCPDILDIKNKFKGSQCLFDYFLSIQNRFYSDMTSINTNNLRFIYFCLDKQILPTRIQPLPIHDSPEHALKISNPYQPISIVDLI